MKVLVDTNFVISCVKQRIDFEHLAEELFDEPIEWFVLEDVLRELEFVAGNKEKKAKDRAAAEFGLEILKSGSFERIDYPGEGSVDKKIVSFLNEHKEFVLATLDKRLKKKVKNRIMTIRDKKKLEVF